MAALLSDLFLFQGDFKMLCLVCAISYALTTAMAVRAKNNNANFFKCGRPAAAADGSEGTDCEASNIAVRRRSRDGDRNETCRGAGMSLLVACVGRR